MYEQEDNTCPYDNVEFPVRTPGTGTWPGPGSGGTSPSLLSSASPSSSPSSSPSVSSGGAPKFYGQHSLSRAGAIPRLAPLVEVATESGSQDTITITSTTSTTTSTSSSSLSTPSYIQNNRTPGSFGAKTISSSNTSSSSTNNKIGQNSFVTTNTTAATSTTSQTTLANSSAVKYSSPAVTTTTSSASKQTTSKPVISVTNDSNLYMATQVTSSDGTMKKKSASLKCLDAEEDDFKRHDFNPGSRLALEKVYTCHPDFYQLNSKILDEGSLLKQDVLDIFRKTGETLTYEQLIQGMLVDGERFLLGSCWLYYTYVQFLDVEGTKILRQPYGRGRIGLTSKRVLFMSTETYTDASLEPYGDPTKRKDGGYKLEVSKQSNVVFKNIPLSNFHSAEMEVITGTSVLTKITKKAFCGCLGISSSEWVTTPPTTRSVNSRVLRVGVSMPPWQTRMFMDIYLDPAMSLTVARDFISQLHSFAPHMH